MHRALAAQIHSLAERVGIEEDLVLTGGGATDAGLIMALEDSLKIPVRVPPEPLFTAALGAALLAREKSLTQGA